MLFSPELKKPLNCFVRPEMASTDIINFGNRKKSLGASSGDSINSYPFCSTTSIATLQPSHCPVAAKFILFLHVWRFSLYFICLLDLTMVKLLINTHGSDLQCISRKRALFDSFNTLSKQDYRTPPKRTPVQKTFSKNEDNRKVVKLLLLHFMKTTGS